MRITFFCLLVLTIPQPPAATADEVDFVRQIQPLLAKHCHQCHGADEQEARLRLDAREALRRGGLSGAVLQPGRPDVSLLIKRLTSKDETVRMPLDEPPLSDNEIDLFRKWIAAGAKWPDGVGAVLEKHWSYRRPRRPPPPNVRNAAWAANAIDRFVLHRLEAEGLSGSPRQHPARLIRRVYLDLIGIPPTVEQVDAFLANPSPEAYETVVDRLLNSPRYGERWARPWLDLARYADSNGYQADQFRHVWAYRDWVIKAMNDDMPFDRFTIEQLAGDLLPNATVAQKIATGFHRLTTCNVEAGVDPEKNRVEQVIDRVNTTATVWLGTTLECAQCHNHKYDPFDQRDYYRMFAYFNNTPLEVEGNGVTYNFVGPKMNLPLPPEQQKRLDDLDKKIAALQSRLDALLESARERLPEWERKWAESRKQKPQWSVLKVESFKSARGASSTQLDDLSVLVGGERPETDTYTIEARTELRGVTAFRLEALTDPSLPGKGPGRHSAERPNFVLQEFRVEASECDGEKPPRPVALTSAKADFSQKNWHVRGTIDDNEKTGWGINPQFGKPHHAIFVAGSPIDYEGGARLTFTLVQNHGQGRTIGRLRLSALVGSPEEVESLPPAVLQALKQPAGKRTAKQSKALLDHFLRASSEVKKLRQQIAVLQKQRGSVKAESTLVMIEMQKARATNILRRGDFKNKAEAVKPGPPAVLHPADSKLPGNRLGFARWLVDPANPLVGRVTVNRWWTEFFGRGLVETPEDFGSRGARPTHPQLLDWLAAEFVESGWSRKHVHKQIVMSATYQQTAMAAKKLRERDPYNALYARGPRLRMSAEMLRDNALQISGVLSVKMGGPPIYPPQPSGVWRHVGRNAPKYATSTGADRHRRGIYVVWRRSAPYANFVNFDAPDRSSCVVKRPRTNTPLQALTLMNDPAYLEMAWALAERVVKDRSDTRQRAVYAFRRCVSRAPTDEEVGHLSAVVEHEAARLAKDEIKLKKLLANRKPPQGVTAAEFAAWSLAGGILLNLDETITK